MRLGPQKNKTKTKNKIYKYKKTHNYKNNSLPLPILSKLWQMQIANLPWGKIPHSVAKAVKMKPQTSVFIDTHVRLGPHTQHWTHLSPGKSIQCVLHVALSYMYCEHWIVRVWSSPWETWGRHWGKWVDIYTLIASSWGPAGQTRGTDGHRWVKPSFFTPRS